MRVGARLLFACASTILSPAAWAQVPAGPVFPVNSDQTGYQNFPLIAMESDGDFIVVWDHRIDIGPPDVVARRFTAGGAALGGDFRVNAYTTAIQWPTSRGISVDARGNVVIPWTDSRVGSAVFARRLSGAGELLGDDFRVSSPGTAYEQAPAAAAAADGRFVVVWEGVGDVFGRRFDPFGNAVGMDFRVNTYTTGEQNLPDVAVDGAGNFTVVWQSYGQDSIVAAGIYGQRFDASGQPLGGEFPVNTFTTGTQGRPGIALRRDGSAVVVWEGLGPGIPNFDVWARRYSSAGAPLGAEFRVSAVSELLDSAQRADVVLDEPGNFVISWTHLRFSNAPLVKGRRYAADGTPRGGEFQVGTPSYSAFTYPSIASDAVGNFTVVWGDIVADARDVAGQRFGGLVPAGLSVEDGGNDILEVPDDFVLFTSWRNLSGAARTFEGRSSGAVVPPGLDLILGPASNYGTVSDGAVGTCTGACFSGGLFGTRPAGHVDLSFVETILPDAQGQAKRWVVHVGGSFTDVPSTSTFYRFVETLLHRGVTGGCAPSRYCPAASTTREQMAVFLLLAREGSTYAPPACTTPRFGDVPPESPFCGWIEELARRGVTAGCGGSNYCPSAAVSREQMAVFLLRTLDPSLTPPACTTPMFEDVPADSLFCRWIEELVRRGVASGCAPGRYCPVDPVTREQMAVFLTQTFGLMLYGP